MMKNKTGRWSLAFLTVWAVCFSFVVKAQTSQSREAFATMSASSSEVRWQVNSEYSRLVLTVSVPKGKIVRREFERGADPCFKLTDEKGTSLPDGHYKYELQLVPNFSQEVRERLARSREEGNAAEEIEELQRSRQLPTTALVQSGSFLVENGQVYDGGGEEPPAAKEKNISINSKGKKGGGGFTIQDNVIADDLIVQGSACIGLDCINGESFGSDTIRLKENNLRIKFDDTSTLAGYPANDWQLTANDDVSGGLSKFSIEDITAGKIPFTIEAGAHANSIRIDSDGKIGLRTATPEKDVHLKTNNTPTIRLEQTAGGGFSPYSWDIAGNDANFFIRDQNTGFFPFRIDPGAPSWSIRIASSGNVGVGTASPSSKLHVAGQILSSGTDAGLTAAPRDGSGANHQWYNPTGDDMRLFNTVSGDVVTVLNNGNFGIGTTAPAGKLDVNGSIFQRGVQLFADYVFEPSYTVESIEDHAAFMWNYKHLPAVGARQLDEQGREFVEIGARMRGMLEEIEKAHIYIATLNDSIAQKDAELSKLAKQNEELAERLARIEAMLSASKSEKKSSSDQ
jgi:uncharacterized coiled-coil protein SlyX